MPERPVDDLNATTHPPTPGTEPGAANRAVEHTALVVLWSRDERGRIGEALLVSPKDPEPWIFGRGDARPREGPRRISLVQQRPGALSETGPVECPRISRAQLRLVSSPAGGLLVENLGTCAMLHNGQEVTRAEVNPGDRLALKNELLLLCVARSIREPAASELPPPFPFGEADAFGIVGESQPAWDLRLRIFGLARQEFHTLILGESGSGKELVAHAIHAQSARGGRPMVARNATTIPQGLADAELFGNVRNYPNVGMPERPGLVGQAHGSTLFLDEFAELPPAVQTRLLRVMDGGEYHRLGEATARRADVRILGATNRPVSYVKHDVLARLKVRVDVPDLNARREDIPLIAAHLLRHHSSNDPALARRLFGDGERRGVPSISPVLIEALIRYRYTTHVRELDALLIRSAIDSDGDGRYVELWARSDGHAECRAIGTAAGRRGVDPLLSLSFVEERRLLLLRRHQIQPRPAAAVIPTTRATDKRLICICAFCSAGPSTYRTGRPCGRPPCWPARMTGLCGTKPWRGWRPFLSNLRTRLSEEPGVQLQRALVAEWKGNAEIVHQVIEALRAGKISLSSPPPRGSGDPA